MEINLLPWRDEIIAYNKKFFIRLILIAIIASGCFLVFSYYTFFGRLSYAQSYTTALEKAKVNLITNVSSYFTYKKTQKEIAARLLTLQSLQKSRFETVRLFNGIAKITPTGVYLSKMSRKNNDVDISGVANSNLLISQLMKSIDDSPELDVVSLREAKKTESDYSTLSYFDLHVVITMSDVALQPQSMIEKSGITNPMKVLQEHREEQKKLINSAVQSESSTTTNAGK